MRYILISFFVVGCLCSCSEKGASDLDQLKNRVKDALEGNEFEELSRVTYREGADEEVREAVAGILSSFGSADLSLVKIEVHQFNDYKPEADLPGQLNGQKLEWLSKPSHWIVASLSNQDESGNGMELEMCFPAGEVDGKWWLIGSTYSDDPVMQDIIVPGLTDTNATAIAFDDDANVVDFVHVEPDSEIETIIFHAPADGSRLSVVVVGPSRHQDLSDGLVVSSYVSGETFGEVTVHVSDGVVTGIFGNAMSQVCPLDEEVLKLVLDQLKEGTRKLSDSVEITTK